MGVTSIISVIPIFAMVWVAAIVIVSLWPARDNEILKSLKKLRELKLTTLPLVILFFMFLTITLGIIAVQPPTNQVFSYLSTMLISVFATLYFLMKIFYG